MKNHIQPNKRGPMKRKALLVLCTLLAVLVVCPSMIGGTVAYLKHVTPEIVNTFELAELNYELTYVANKPTAATADVAGMPDVYNPTEKKSVATGKSANGECTFTASAPTLTGYQFLGWADTADATKAVYEPTNGQTSVPVDYSWESFDRATQTISKIVYAVWKQMDFTLSFDTQAADVPNPDSKIVTYLEKYGELPTVERVGYTFNGWSLSADGANPVTAETQVLTAVNHTLYAQWIPHTYTVKYVNNVDPNNTSITQPTGSTADSTHTYDVASPLTANGFTRTGYTFTGWNTQADGKGVAYTDGQTVTNLTSTNGDVVTLYAQWGVKTYVIRYHANGGSGTMADQVIEWDKLTKLSENTFEPMAGDYSFAGWATSPEGAVEYLENQQVVNLLESGTLDLYAVWLRNSYTVTFDYNIGYGTPPTKQVLYNEEYGVLPPYLTTETENLFKGWYTAPEGGTRVYPSTIVNRKENHTLWAHWDPSPANDIIKELVVHSSADDNNDGVADEMHLEFVCSSNFEKFNIPLHNLIPGQKYALTYTTSNNASFGDHPGGYSKARYGSYILPTATEDAGNIDTAVAKDIIATWNDRIEPDGTNDGSHAATNDAWLNGPWNRTITFTATKETMYWAWEFGLMQDHIRNDYNIYDISLVPVAPKIEFASKTVGKGASSAAKIESQNNNTYSTTFVFNGDGGCETVYYPITGLNAGSTYTITFNHEFSGPLIHDTKSNPTPTYEYGCGIMNTVPDKTGNKMTDLGTWASTTTFVKKTVDSAVDSVTLTFTATSDTAYWVWNMANCSDSRNTTTKVTVTKFSANHSGKTITYYTAPSAGAVFSLRVKEIPYTVDLPGVEVTGLENMVPGEDLVLTLTGELPSVIQLEIDGELYMTGEDWDLVDTYALAMDAWSQPEWLVPNEDGSYTLTIMGMVIKDGTTILMSGVDFNTQPLDDMTYDDLA